MCLPHTTHNFWSKTYLSGVTEFSPSGINIELKYIQVWSRSRWGRDSHVVCFVINLSHEANIQVTVVIQRRSIMHCPQTVWHVWVHEKCMRRSVFSAAGSLKLDTFFSFTQYLCGLFSTEPGKKWEEKTSASSDYTWYTWKQTLIQKWMRSKQKDSQTESFVITICS